MAELALRIDGLSKTFPGQRALHDVSLDVRRGEIHALLGENGSGKSTLIKCLAGVHPPDAGSRIEIAGSALRVPYSPAEAIAAGCGFVHQDLGLIAPLTVMENLALSTGFQTGTGRRIRWGHQRMRAAELLARIGDHIDPAATVASLPQADRTLVAIARGLHDAELGGGVLVLDEPTAALPAAEVEVLFAALDRIRAMGVGMIYVSHRLDEVLRIADRATVLRDGVKVGTHDVEGMAERRLIELIVGRPLDLHYPPAEATRRENVVLATQHLAGARVVDASFAIHAGEVVGVAGLLGSGRSELGRLLFGAQQRTGGAVALEGRPLELRHPRDAIAAGIALIPEDRASAGAHLGLTVRENMMLPDLSAFTRWGRVDRRAERREAEALIGRFGVRPPRADKRFGSLSGGNQQKAILAKWMRLEPKVLILDEPVQGVDIGARAEIYRLIGAAAARGAAVLMIDSDLEDLCRLCDRILVLHGGRIVRELAGGTAGTRDRILDVLYTGATA